MKKLFVSIYKEGLLLLRDIEGVVLLFFMPVILEIIEQKTASVDLAIIQSGGSAIFLIYIIETLSAKNR